MLRTSAGAARSLARCGLRCSTPDARLLAVVLFIVAVVSDSCSSSPLFVLCFKHKNKLNSSMEECEIVLIRHFHVASVVSGNRVSEPILSSKAATS